MLCVLCCDVLFRAVFCDVLWFVCFVSCCIVLGFAVEMCNICCVVSCCVLRVVNCTVLCCAVLSRVLRCVVC